MRYKDASEKAKAVLREATECEDAVCYINSEDKEWLETAIKALELTDKLQFSKKDLNNYYDNIEDEIYALTDTIHVNSENPYEDKTYVRLADVIWIIDQHMKEVEDDGK